jgi:hypothetical protein
MICSTRRTILLAAAAATVILPATLSGPASAAAGTLDQSQLQTGGTATLEKSYPLAQTFTAGRTGELDRVDLLLVVFSGTEPLTLSLRTVAQVGGPPTDTVLAQTVIPAAQVVEQPGTTTARFSAPAQVTAGQQYALVLTTDHEPPDPTQISWRMAPGAPYSGGSGFTTPPASSWTAAGWDAAFATYVAGDDDADGYFADDCDDTDPDVNPGTRERWNQVDDDCDGIVDEGLSTSSAPRIGDASSGAVGGAVNATARWNRPVTNGGIPITGYKVEAQKLNAAGAVVARVTRNAAPSARSLVVRLDRGRYKFRVAAVNDAGQSLWSARSAAVKAR